MKKLKLLVIATMMVGLWSGSASAILVDDEFNLGGDQTDGWGSGVSIGSGDSPIAVNHWIGITVDAVLPQGSEIDFSASGGQTSILTPSLNLVLWEATDNGGGDWSTVGAPLITQIPAGNFTPMTGTLMAGGTYLMQFFGDILYADCTVLPCSGGDPQDALYSMSMISNNVPVPAAIWLFGTAVVGLAGLRRKQKLSAVAA